MGKPVSLYNTLTRRTEAFSPERPGHVRMYVCGVTVYDLAHVGHARTYVVFDVLARYLESLGNRVTYVRNITDVDDRIIERANASATTAAELGARMADAFIADAAALGLRAPDVEPRATQHIAEMIELITELERRGFAYRSDGDVYFDVRALPAYGKLSNRKLDELLAGARVEVSEVKRYPGDFALWKGAKPGEPVWESPFGPGRPGWHIECSAMSSKYLGQPFDLHGGGEDLIFPHHENEIAQSEAAVGKPFARHWMHVAFLRRGSEKMSKSLGNFVTIRQALERYPAEALRLFLLQTHYRSPMEFSEEAIDEARAALARMYETLARAGIKGDGAALWAEDGGEPEALAELQAALGDDLNTPRAVAVLHDAVRAANRLLDAGQSAQAKVAAAGLREAARVLGLLASDPATILTSWRGSRALAAGLSSAEVELLIEARNAARRARDFKTADAIRGRLVEAGIDLKDRPDGQTDWSVRR